MLASFVAISAHSSPYNLGSFWRRTSAVDPCPTNFVLVPSNSAVGTYGDFCVAKYETKNVSGVATSQPASAPWVSINRTNASAACEAAGFSLISNAQWQTIARDVAATASNWSGGSVGSGKMYRGNTDNPGVNSLAVSNTSDPYDGTGNNSGQAIGSGGEQRRTLTLSNGGVVWDMSGNVWEIVSTPMTGSALSPTITTAGYQEFTNTTYFPAADTGNRLLFGPSTSTYNSTHYVGTVYGGTGDVVGRGAGPAEATNGGIFTGSLNSYDATLNATSVGFRCVKAGSLSFTTQPSSRAQVATNLTQQPVVTLTDLSGATFSTSSVPITLTAYTDSTCTTLAGGTLTATTNPLNVSSGVASFSGVQYSTMALIYLKASSPGFKSACSNAIAVGTPNLSWFAGAEAESSYIYLFDSGTPGSGAGTAESGNRAYVMAWSAGNTDYGCKTMNLTGAYYLSFSVYFTALGPTATLPIFSLPPASGGTQIELRLNTSNQLEYWAGTTLVGTSSTLSAATWYLIEINRPSTAVSASINGNSLGTYASGSGISQICMGKNAASPGSLSSTRFDDFAITITMPPGNVDVGLALASSTAPTYDGFTKSNSSTIDTVWNSNPGLGTTTPYVQSAASSVAQTMVVSTVALGSTNDLNTSRIVLFGDRGTGAACTVWFRRRVGGLNSDEPVSLTTSAAHHLSSGFRPTTAQLATLEIGVARASCTSQTTTIYSLGYEYAYPK